MPSHYCVWIDHREARIFAVGITGDTSEMVANPAAHAHIHREADHVGLGKTPPEHAFVEEIASALEPARAILIVGPGTARNELAGYLNDYRPSLGRRVWGIEAMDHPTDRQIAAAARKYFHAAESMHP